MSPPVGVAVFVATVTALLVSGCGISGSGECTIADGQQPINGRTHEQVLAELSEPDGGWPLVPDGEWGREDVGETVVYRNGDAEVSFMTMRSCRSGHADFSHRQGAALARLRACRSCAPHRSVHRHRCSGDDG